MIVQESRKFHYHPFHLKRIKEQLLSIILTFLTNSKQAIRHDLQLAPESIKIALILQINKNLQSKTANQFQLLISKENYEIKLLSCTL